MYENLYVPANCSNAAYKIITIIVSTGYEYSALLKGSEEFLFEAVADLTIIKTEGQLYGSFTH